MISANHQICETPYQICAFAHFLQIAQISRFAQFCALSFAQIAQQLEKYRVVPGIARDFSSSDVLTGS